MLKQTTIENNWFSDRIFVNDDESDIVDLCDDSIINDELVNLISDNPDEKGFGRQRYPYESYFNRVADGPNQNDKIKDQVQTRLRINVTMMSQQDGFVWFKWTIQQWVVY